MYRPRRRGIYLTDKTHSGAFCQEEVRGGQYGRSQRRDWLYGTMYGAHTPHQPRECQSSEEIPR